MTRRITAASIRPAACCGLLLASGSMFVACSQSTTAARPGAPPQHVDGIYLCVAPAQVPAYHHRAYPTNYPTPPPKTARPNRCFVSIRQAAHAGYPLARTPRRDRLIGGVYPVPQARAVTRLCRRSVRTAQLAVPCPTLVPGDPASAFCNVGSPCAQPGWFVLEGSFAGGPHYVGVLGGGGHLYIIGFTRRDGVWPRDTLAGGAVIGRAHVHGHRATFLSYPTGSRLNSEHIVLVWHDRDTTSAVSLHGHSIVNRRLDLAIATHLRLLTG